MGNEPSKGTNGNGSGGSSQQRKSKHRNPASNTPKQEKQEKRSPDKEQRTTESKSVRLDVPDVAPTSSPTKRTVGDDSAHTFAASLASQSGRFRRGNDYVMITDALSDVRQKYHIEPKELGHGHYGVVRKCRNRETQQLYAIKSIRKAKVNKIEVLMREIEILKEVEHPNIIRLEEVFEDERYLHLVTELCTGGELFDRIIAKTQSPEGHFSEHDAASLVRDILDAIRYCHDEKGIVHRDLKPENFLFLTDAEDAKIKIIDFGLSRHDDIAVMKTKVGTPYYVAPEVLRREYTKKCDIWSIGVISYILLCGYPPFYGDSDQQIFESVRLGQFTFPSPEWNHISETAKDFVKFLLKKDPGSRPTAEEAMKHAWIIKEVGEGKKMIRKILHGERGVSFAKHLAMKKLKKAALGYIASNLTMEQVGYLGEIFRSIDHEQHGFLTLTELDEAIAQGNFSPQIQEDLRHLRDRLCVSHEESLNWKDFLAGTIDKNIAMRNDNLRMVFDHFNHGQDADHLKYEDVLEIFGGEAQANEVMTFLDSDGDGMISFEDFRHAVEESLEQVGDEEEEDD